MSAIELVGMLNEIVRGFDQLTDRHDLEKIKTIGDAYFCVGGLQQSSDHPERVLHFGIDVFGVLRNYNANHKRAQINIRIGINTGGAIAGIIGTKKFGKFVFRVIKSNNNLNENSFRYVGRYN